MVFAPKWQLALTLLRQVRSAGFTVTAVVGDAECGNNATLRRVLHRATRPYALGVSSDLHVFVGTPVLDAPAPLTGRGRGDSSPGATAPRPPGAPAFVLSESHRRTIGVRNDDSHPKSGCFANGARGRARTRSFRRPQPAGMATPCRLDSPRPQLSLARTVPTRAHAADTAAGARRHPRRAHR